MMNSREAAFLALFHSLKGECFISDYLDQWYFKQAPTLQDYHFAQQIAYGAAQRALSLDYFIKHVSEKKKIQLKLKEKALLRTAMYQMCFLDKVPVYAIVDESMKIAKKYFHKYFSSYLHAVLKKISSLKPVLPQGLNALSLSIKFSYPLSFVEDLCSIYGVEKAINLLEAGNNPAVVMARVRGSIDTEEFRILIKQPCKVAVIPSARVVEIANSENYYIQNVTPAYLIGNLSQQIKNVPERILDMCASPGGKSLAVHDFFPDAAIYANDVSLKKTERLKANFMKYKVPAVVSCCDGQLLEDEEKFDLIILDVPCSNSGVLNKRPEARWRINEDHLMQLKKIQLSLIEHAIHLLKADGEIWYMTCSILPKENEDIVNQACEKVGFVASNMLQVLPNDEGWDGGFACSLKLR